MEGLEWSVRVGVQCKDWSGQLGWVCSVGT